MSLQNSVASGFIPLLLSSQSPAHAENPSPSKSNPSSTIPSQLSSKLLHNSIAPGYDNALPSLQSSTQEKYPSPSKSAFVVMNELLSLQSLPFVTYPEGISQPIEAVSGSPNPSLSASW